jgi:hypothetical protein
MTSAGIRSGGCCARRATAPAHLYGATVALTMACSAFSIASSRACPPCSTTPPAMTVQQTGAEVRAGDPHGMRFIL